MSVLGWKKPSNCASGLTQRQTDEVRRQIQATFGRRPLAGISRFLFCHHPSSFCLFLQLVLGGLMGVPLSQMWTVAAYVLGRRLRGVERYPLVLMLEPLFRCNLACQGCGKIQHPTEILRRHLTPEQCWQAADECGAPMVSIPGGEPLLHPADRRNRGRPRGAQEIRLSLHQRAEAGRDAGAVHAEQVPVLLGAPGRPARRA